ncbi:hypothetical protein cyc_06718 [Cyclospora cayetanensis]|uniref:Uncharacterized protein n=1 Tax=Cyclospora cayetanensis TaxID=88456 RepID=A0A1D3D1G7_9EIME|nr:hypothetical protein cyc_06718 [Cyclospora cayetanensis]
MAFSAAGATGESPREAATEALPPAASEGREARQQHAYDVSIVAAEAASAASKLFEGHLKERVSQMLLLLQEDPHQQPKEKELNRQPHKWNAHTRPRQSKSTRAEGLFDVSSGVGVRDCYSSCCKSLPGGLSPVTPGGSRKRGSLLSNASVGKNLSGRHWPFTSAPVADAPVASAASGLAIHHAAPSFIPQNRHARTLERLSAPAQIDTRTSTGVCHVSSEADTPEDEIAAKGGEKGEVLAFQATPAVNGSSPHTAVAQLPVARPQKAQTSGLSIAFLGERLQPQRVPSLHKPPAAHLYPLPMSGIPGDLQQEKRDDCCSPFTQANAPLLTSPRVQQSVLEKWAREQQAQRPVQGLSLEAPDWLGDVQKTNACHSDKKEDKELEIVAKKHATDAPMGGDQRINVFHRVEVTQEDKSSTQQQLMQSYAGSISSVDLQGFSSLRMPLRELLNDQESLLEALDAEYREPPVAPHSTDSKYALPLEEEVERYESAGASVQLGGEDRGNHRDVEGNGSVPMPLVRGRECAATVLKDSFAAL